LRNGWRHLDGASEMPGALAPPAWDTPEFRLWSGVFSRSTHPPSPSKLSILQEFSNRRIAVAVILQGVTHPEVLQQPTMGSFKGDDAALEVFFPAAKSRENHDVDLLLFLK